VRILRVVPEADPEVRKALHPGDEILAIDGQPIGTRTVDMITQRIRGPLGTTVKLRVRLRTSHRIADFSFRRKAFE
jgi:C-terminal processing protease CtpA/Prc